MIQALTNFFNALTSRPCTKNQPAGHNRSGITLHPGSQSSLQNLNDYVLGSRLTHDDVLLTGESEPWTRICIPTGQKTGFKKEGAGRDQSQPAPSKHSEDIFELRGHYRQAVVERQHGAGAALGMSLSEPEKEVLRESLGRLVQNSATGSQKWDSGWAVQA